VPITLPEPFPFSALVPSREADRAAELDRLGKSLAQSLELIDGVVAARVHLAVPARDPFADADAPPPSASVILRCASSLAVTDDELRRAVASGVAGLDPSRVSVLRVVARPAPPAAELVRVGPFTTTTESAGKLRAVVSLFAVLSGVGAIFGLFTWFRRKRPRRATRLAREAP